MAALLMQAERLGKVSTRHARALWSQMAQKGWKRREPANLDLPEERPSLVKELIQLYRSELAYTPHELSQSLHADENDVRSWYYQQGNLRMAP